MNALPKPIPLPVSSASRARSEYKSGYGLPAYYFNSDEQYRSDVRVLRETQWILVGHASEIPNAGDYRLFEFDRESIVLIRDKSGEIKAFYNVCRHRGSRVLLEPRGNVKLMTCPYHAWTYRLDGSLLPPRSMPKSFDPKEHGLVPVAINVHDGLLFISLATGTPPDFESFISRLRPFFDPYSLGRTKVVAREAVPAATNWKLPVENFYECYHCPNAHKDLSRILTINPGAEIPDEAGETRAQKMVRLGLATEALADNPESQHLQMALQLEIGRRHLSASMNGQPASRLLGKFTEWTGGWTVMNMNPLSHAVMYDDYVQLIIYTPLDVNKAMAEMIWLVHEDAVEGVDYDLEKLTALMRVTMNEDKRITDDSQPGLYSSAYLPGVLAEEEYRVGEFHRWYFHNVIDAN